MNPKNPYSRYLGLAWLATGFAIFIAFLICLPTGRTAALFQAQPLLWLAWMFTAAAGLATGMCKRMWDIRHGQAIGVPKIGECRNGIHFGLRLWLGGVWYSALSYFGIF